MARTKQTMRKASEGTPQARGQRAAPLPDVTHTPPVVEGGLLHTRYRVYYTFSQILCRAMRELRRRPCPFTSVQTAHEVGNCWAQVVLHRGHFTGQTTITTYGANEEEAYQKAVMAALVNLSSTEEAGPTVLRFLPTDEMDDE